MGRDMVIKTGGVETLLKKTLLRVELPYAISNSRYSGANKFNS